MGKKPWTAEEDHKIKVLNNIMSYKEKEKHLPNKAESEIKERAIKLNISENTGWTSEEDIKLKKIYCVNTTKDVVEHFPNRDAKSIIHRAHALGLYKHKNKRAKSIKINN